MTKLDAPANNRNHNTQLEFIGAGLSRAGTLSLKYAMEEFFGHKGVHGFDMFHPYWRGLWYDLAAAEVTGDEAAANQALDALVKEWSEHGYTFTLDMPACFLYKELMERYPEAKVILTVRDNPKVWAKSVAMVFRLDFLYSRRPFSWLPSHGAFSEMYGKWLYPIRMGVSKDHFYSEGHPSTGTFLSEETMIDLYNNWTDQVQKNVPPNKLLVYNVKEGWSPLCNFMGISPGDCPLEVDFPRVNHGSMGELKAVLASMEIVSYIWPAILGLMLYGAYKMAVLLVRTKRFSRKVALAILAVIVAEFLREQSFLLVAVVIAKSTLVARDVTTWVMNLGMVTKILGTIFCATVASSKDIQKLLLLLVGVPPTMLWLSLENKYRLVTLDFSRGNNELLESHDFLRNILNMEDWQLVEIKPSGSISTEPDKNETSMGLTLTFTKENGETVQKKVFCKFQTGRGMALWLQAIRIVVEPGVAREIDFYAKISKDVPILVPDVYYAGKNTSVNRVCLIIEHFEVGTDVMVYPDHSKPPLALIEGMMKNVALLHSRYLGTVCSNEKTNWIPARRGLEYCSFVDGLMPKDNPFYTMELWQFLKNEFADRTMTLIHGDCRPGNMMFREKTGEVVFADWEAVNIGPPLWDFVYSTSLGLCAADRRKHQMRLLNKCYLPGFEGDEKSIFGPNNNGKSNSELKKEQIGLLTVVLGYVSLVVTSGGFWSAQGNTDTDLLAWEVRMSLALSDVDPSLSPLLPGLVENAQENAARIAAEKNLTLEELSNL